MLFIVFGGEPSAYVQEHPPHAHGDGVARWSMYLRSACWRARGVGGWIQFAGVWTTDLRLARAGRRAARRGRATRRRRSRASPPSRSGSPGSASPGAIYSGPPRAGAAAGRACSSTSSTSTSSTTRLFYRPAVALARRSTASSSGRSSAARSAASATRARWAGSRARALQTGLVRSYALALATGVAVLALVFVAVR